MQGDTTYDKTCYQNQLLLLVTGIVALLSRAQKMNLHLLSVQCRHPACAACLHILGK